VKQDKYALVTGSADRIGKSIAIQLAAMGYHVVVHYKNSRKKAESLKKEIEGMGRKVHVMQFDFLQTNDFDRLFVGLKAQQIILEVLVNSASDFVPSGFDDLGDTMLSKQIKSNFDSAYLLTKSFARVFGEGSIINILDTKVTKDRTRHLDYILSKKLLGEFTRISAVHLAPEIRVNAICPGLILPPEGKDEQYLLDLASGIPLQRIGSVEDIQRTVQFLVESSFVTGQFLYIDGGEHLRS